ncbi:MAG: hypothetical protein IH898_14230 [Planctomycetes bacterium]|nr:hypothetical protein [Planctomycetota bacterium]
MEPVLLGLAAPKLLSAATAVGRRAVEPFVEALDAARGLLGEKSELQLAPSKLAPARNPHSQLLSESLTGQPLISGDGSIEIEDIRTHADALQDSLQRRIHELLERSGIKLDDAVQLRVSPLDGQLEVEGDTPQRAVLEAALASDPSIAADFRQLSAMRSLLAAADKHTEFAEAYARDPYQAVADYAELFDAGLRATLQFTLTEAQLRFEFS